MTHEVSKVTYNANTDRLLIVNEALENWKKFVFHDVFTENFSDLKQQSTHFEMQIFQRCGRVVNTNLMQRER